VSLGATLGEVLPLAVAKMVAPTIVAIPLLLLIGGGGRAKAATFSLGWFIAPVVLGTAIALVVAALNLPEQTTQIVGGVLKVVLGLVFVLLTVVLWRQGSALIPYGRGSDDKNWSENIQRFSPMRAFNIGILVSSGGFKANALLLATLAQIANAGLSLPQAVIVLLVYAAIGSLLIATPLFIAWFFGERADAKLGAMRDWLDAHGNAVVLGVLLVVGVWLLGKGLGGLLG
jgi:cytochrome c biogenesis protein CcdA